MRHFFKKRIHYLFISLFLAFLPIRSYSQSRINVDQVVRPRPNRVLKDSINLFANSYLDTTFFPLLRDTTVKKMSITDSLKYIELDRRFRMNYSHYARVRDSNRNHAKIAALETIIDDLKQLLRLKPGDPTLRRYLTLFWSQMYSPYNELGDSLKLIQLNTNLLFLTDRKTHYSRYLVLAQNYIKLNEYKLSIKAYNRAIEDIFEFYADSLDNGGSKYANYLFSALYGRGNCEEKLYLDEQALRSRQHSLVVAPENYKKAIESNIKLKLLWDDGNLPAYEKKNEALKLLGEKKYREAREKLLDLLPELKTRAAEIEIQRYIAQAEFMSGDSYLALERLQKIVNHFPFDSPQFDSTEVDSIYQSYVEFYTQVCNTQGYKEWQVQNSRDAYIYFSKAADLPSHIEAMACFWLARLLMVKNSIMHTDQLIDYGLRAWNNEENPLPNQYKKELARVLFQAYRQIGDFNEAMTWFQRVHTIEN